VNTGTDIAKTFTRILVGLLLLAMFGLIGHLLLDRGSVTFPGSPSERLLGRLAYELAMSSFATGILITCLWILYPKGQVLAWIQTRSGTAMLTCLAVVALVAITVALHLLNG